MKHATPSTNARRPTQLEYIQCLELAYIIIERSGVLGCCIAIELAVIRIDVPNVVYTNLLSLFEETYRDNPSWIYYWKCNKRGRRQRLIALSFLINIIETENLFK